MNDECFPGPPEFIPSHTKPNNPLELPKTRRYLDIYISDGINRKLLATQDLPDAEPKEVCELSYSEKVLNIDELYKQVPEEFHLVIHNYLGAMSQKDYQENVSEIILVWAS